MTPTRYNNLNELLAEYSQLSAQLAAIESDVNLQTLAAVKPLLPQHAETTARIAEIEGKLREIAVANPELFPEDKRTHTTPFGAIAFRKTTSLDFDDEEKVILKIKVACAKELQRSERFNAVPRFTEEQLLRTRQEPNLEALEKLDDAELTGFGIARKTEEKFTVKPLEVKADKLAKKSKAEANAKNN
jgi:hypothetical protein